MPPLRIEVSRPGDTEWRQAGLINPGDPYGSISDNTTDGRDVYYFGLDMVEGVAVIKRSEAGIDVTTGNSRVIEALGGMSLIASLQPGQNYEMTG